MSNASVLLAGVGNIGSPLAALMARSGIHLLRLVDRDRVERKNLATQDFLPEDVGRFKAEVLAERLAGRFPGLAVEARTTDLEDLPAGDCRVDLVLGALDSRRGRQVLISELAWPLGVPVIDGGVGEGLRGRVQVFCPRQGAACLECTWGQADYRQASVEYPCAPGDAHAVPPPTAAPAHLGAIVAGIMSVEALRLLEGSVPEDSQEIAFDLSGRRLLASRLRRAPRCRFDHEVVDDFFPLNREFATATVADLLAVIDAHLQAELVHLECRRKLFPGRGLESGRFVAVASLRSCAGALLSAVGLSAQDLFRVRTGSRSALVVLTKPRGKVHGTT
jgi:adenylyltransferase/sulfurtransferase